MKPIKGQTLLSIHQYFPTDYLRMAKKSTGMMNLFIENISEKVRKGIMDCDLESSSLEINNQAKPLFTLTAEEVTIVEHFLTCDKKKLETYESSQENDIMIEDLNHILRRIKEWQDGQN